MSDQTLQMILAAKNASDQGFQAFNANVRSAQAEVKKTNAAFQELGRVVNGQAQSMAGSLGSFSGVVQSLGPAGVAAAAGLGAIVVVTKSVIDEVAQLAKHADSLAALRDRTHQSFEALQELQLAAKLGNTSVEALAASANRMQRALVETPEKFRSIGLEVDKLRQMKPEDQFREVAKAIIEIRDPAQQTTAVMDIMGRGAAAQLSAFKALADGSTELAGALSGETVQAAADLQDELDRLDTAWERLQMQLVAAIAESPATIQFLEDVTSGVAGLAQIIRMNQELFGNFFAMVVHNLKPMSDMARLLSLIGPETMPRVVTPTGLGGPSEFNAPGADAALRLLGEGLTADLAKTKRVVDEHERLAKRAQAAWQKAFEESRKASDKMAADLSKNAREALQDMEEDQRKAVKKMADNYAESLIRQLEDDRKAKAQMAATWDQLLDQAFQDNQAMVGDMRQLSDAVDQLGEAVGGTFGDLLTFGAGAFDVLTNLNDEALQGASTWTKVAGAIQGAAAALNSGSFMGGAMAGASAGAAFGPWGALIGGAAGGLMGLLGKGEERKVNDLRDQFIAAAGGLDALNQRAHEAGLTLDKLLAAKRVTDFNAAMGQLQDAFGLQDQAQAQLQAAIDKYGFSVEELGPKFRQQELDKMAMQLRTEYELLTNSGIDHNKVLQKMGPELNDYLQTAIKTGAEVPEAMRKIVEQMIAEGKLLDENGERYENAEDAGVNFATSVSDAMKKAGDQLERIVDMLRQMLGMPPIDIPINFPNNGPPGDDGGRERNFATGGRIPYTPGGMPVRVAEQATENILTDGQLAQIVARAMAMSGGGGGRGGPIVVQLQVGTREFARAVAHSDETGRSRTKRRLRRNA